MDNNLSNLLLEFKQKETELEKEIKRILLEKTSENLRNAFFDGVETTPFDRKKSNIKGIYSWVKGFTGGLMMYLKNEKEGKFFMEFKEEFISFSKEHLGITVKTFSYEVFDSPGGLSHKLLIFES